MAGKAIVRIWNFCLRKSPMSMPKAALSKRSAGRKMTSITWGSMLARPSMSRTRLHLGVQSSSALSTTLSGSALSSLATLSTSMLLSLNALLSSSKR